jgi:hypothetical protein
MFTCTCCERRLGQSIEPCDFVCNYCELCVLCLRIAAAQTMPTAAH